MLIQDKRLKACPESIEGEKDKSFGEDKSPAIILSSRGGGMASHKVKR
ncbi:MAG: hypothetical protein IPJ03_18325 [Ignavibacteriales bacterium]|nr:hypothetical protein [Ignavibacteriales bacterium]